MFINPEYIIYTNASYDKQNQLTLESISIAIFSFIVGELCLALDSALLSMMAPFFNKALNTASLF